MKTKTIFIVSIFLTVLLFTVGCHKNPPAPTPVAPILTVTAPTGTLNYGDSTSFNWTTTGEVTSVTLDSKRVSSNGSHNTGRLLADQSYDLKAVGPGGADSKTIAVKVGDWTTSTFGLLTHESWLFDSTGYKTQSMDSFRMYTHAKIDPSYFVEEYSYLPNGRFITKNINTGVIFEHSWELLPSDTIVIAGVEKRGIKTITKTKMVLMETGYAPDGQVILSKTIYKRDSK